MDKDHKVCSINDGINPVSTHLTGLGFGNRYMLIRHNRNAFKFKVHYWEGFLKDRYNQNYETDFAHILQRILWITYNIDLQELPSTITICSDILSSNITIKRWSLSRDIILHFHGQRLKAFPWQFEMHLNIITGPTNAPEGKMMQEIIEKGMEEYKAEAYPQIPEVNAVESCNCEAPTSENSNSQDKFSPQDVPLNPQEKELNPQDVFNPRINATNLEVKLQEQEPIEVDLASTSQEMFDRRIAPQEMELEVQQEAFDPCMTLNQQNPQIMADGFQHELLEEPFMVSPIGMMSIPQEDSVNIQDMNNQCSDPKPPLVDESAAISTSHINEHMDTGSWQQTYNDIGDGLPVKVHDLASTGVANDGNFLFDPRAPYLDDVKLNLQEDFDISEDESDPNVREGDDGVFKRVISSVIQYFK